MADQAFHNSCFALCFFFVLLSLVPHLVNPCRVFTIATEDVQAEVRAAQEAWREAKRRELEQKQRKKMARLALTDQSYERGGASSQPSAKRVKTYESPPNQPTNEQQAAMHAPILSNAVGGGGVGRVDAQFAYADFSQLNESDSAPVMGTGVGTSPTQQAKTTVVVDAHVDRVLAQRRWREAKLKEIAEKRAKGAASKRGRKKGSGSAAQHTTRASAAMAIAPAIMQRTTTVASQMLSTEAQHPDQLIASMPMGTVGLLPSQNAPGLIPASRPLHHSSQAAFHHSVADLGQPEQGTEDGRIDSAQHVDEPVHVENAEDDAMQQHGAVSMVALIGDPAHGEMPSHLGAADDDALHGQGTIAGSGGDTLSTTEGAANVSAEVGSEGLADTRGAETVITQVSNGGTAIREQGGGDPTNGLRDAVRDGRVLPRDVGQDGNVAAVASTAGTLTSPLARALSDMAPASAGLPVTSTATSAVHQPFARQSAAAQYPAPIAMPGAHAQHAGNPEQHENAQESFQMESGEDIINAATWQGLDSINQH